MADRTVIDCDRCSRQNISPEGRLTLEGCSGWDGIETTTNYYSVDLCTQCLQIELEKRLKNDIASVFIESIKAFKRNKT